MTELTGKQRRALRALGHHLKVVIQIGKDGVAPGLVEAAEATLRQHELVKGKVLEAAPLDREEAAEALAEATGAHLAQVLGRTFLLYKPNPERPRIDLDKGTWREPERPPPAPKPKKPAGKKPSPKKPGERRGTGAKLPPRRHR